MSKTLLIVDLTNLAEIGTDEKFMSSKLLLNWENKDLPCLAPHRFTDHKIELFSCLRGLGMGMHSSCLNHAQHLSNRYWVHLSPLWIIVGKCLLMISLEWRTSERQAIVYHELILPTWMKDVLSKFKD